MRIEGYRIEHQETLNPIRPSDGEHEHDRQSGSSSQLQFPPARLGVGAAQKQLVRQVVLAVVAWEKLNEIEVVLAREKD